MKKLILVAVILQLVITLTSTYDFGDIIVFRRSRCNRSYDHYAIYVGPQSGVNVGQGDNDLFHNPGLFKRCQFGKLEKEREKTGDEKFNYLDNIDDFKPGTTEEIKNRIIHLKKTCLLYEVLSNNCEHLATKVRYNVRVTLQAGTDFEKLFAIRKKAKDLVNKVKENIKLEAECEASSKGSS